VLHSLFMLKDYNGQSFCLSGLVACLSKRKTTFLFSRLSQSAAFDICGVQKSLLIIMQSNLVRLNADN